MGRIFNEISFCLIQLDFKIELSVDLLPQYPPDHYRDVFRCRVEGLEVGSVQVKIFMIKMVQYVFFNDVAKRLQVVDEAGLRRGFARYGYDQFIIVPMKIRIVTFSKYGVIFLG